jgi:hypothetical protein
VRWFVNPALDVLPRPLGVFDLGDDDVIVESELGFDYAGIVEVRTLIYGAMLRHDLLLSLAKGVAIRTESTSRRKSRQPVFFFPRLYLPSFSALLPAICFTFSRQSHPKKGGGENRRL